MMQRVIRISSIVIFGIALLLASFFWVYEKAPVNKLRGIIDYYPPHSEGIRKIGLGVPNNVTLDSISPFLLIAVVALEDQNFPHHHGFDLEEVFSSLRDAIFTSKKLRGASTLSQQLIKNIYFPTSRSLTRKLYEAIYTVKLESLYRKSEIITLYLNNVEWAPKVYGIREAANYYFKKQPGELELEEAACLVVVLPSPLSRSEMVLRGELPTGLKRALSRIHLVADYIMQGSPRGIGVEDVFNAPFETLISKTLKYGFGERIDALVADSLLKLKLRGGCVRNGSDNQR